MERGNLTIADVLAVSGEPPIGNGKPVDKWLAGIMKRARLRRFQQDIYDQFEPILELVKKGIYYV